MPYENRNKDMVPYENRNKVPCENRNKVPMRTGIRCPMRTGIRCPMRTGGAQSGGWDKVRKTKILSVAFTHCKALSYSMEYTRWGSRGSMKSIVKSC